MRARTDLMVAECLVHVQQFVITDHQLRRLPRLQLYQELSAAEEEHSTLEKETVMVAMW